MNDYRSLIGPDSFSKRSHEPRQGLRWTGNAEIWPGSEVKVLYHSLHITLRHVIFFILIGGLTNSKKCSDKLHLREEKFDKASNHSLCTTWIPWYSNPDNVSRWVSWHRYLRNKQAEYPSASSDRIFLCPSRCISLALQLPCCCSPIPFARNHRELNATVLESQ